MTIFTLAGNIVSVSGVMTPPPSRRMPCRLFRRFCGGGKPPPYEDYRTALKCRGWVFCRFCRACRPVAPFVAYR